MKSFLKSIKARLAAIIAVALLALAYYSVIILDADKLLADISAPDAALVPAA